MKKQAELRRTGMMERSTRYTKDELDAVAYFQGTGFYSKVQDSEKNPKPCIYDTRQSFLIKMQDKKFFQFSVKRQAKTSITSNPIMDISMLNERSINFSYGKLVHDRTGKIF